MSEEKESHTAIELMQQGWQARRENRLADAQRDLIEAVALIRQAGAPGELVKALKNLGHVEMDLRHWDEARALYEEAIAICRDEGDPLTLGHTVRHLGDIHRHAGRREDAEACYREAIVLFRNHEHIPKLDLANATRPLAILKDDAGEVDEARRLWEESRELYAAVNVQEGVAECSARLARLSR